MGGSLPLSCCFCCNCVLQIQINACFVRISNASTDFLPGEHEEAGKSWKAPPCGGRNEVRLEGQTLRGLSFIQWIEEILEGCE